LVINKLSIHGARSEKHQIKS